MSTQANVRVGGAATSSTEPAEEAPTYSLAVETLPESSEPPSPHEEADTRSRRKALKVSGASASAPQHSEVIAQGHIATPTAQTPQETSPTDTNKSTQSEQSKGQLVNRERDLEVSGSKESEEPEPAIVELPPTPPERRPQQPPTQPSGQPSESSSKEAPESPSETSSEQPPEALIQVPTIQIHKPSDASSVMAKALGTGVVNSTSVSPMTVPGAAPAHSEAVPQTKDDTPPSVETPAPSLPTPAEAMLSEVPAVAVSDAAVPAQDIPALAPGIMAGRVRKRKRFARKIRRAVLRPGILRILLGKENATLVSKRRDEAGDASKPVPMNAPGPLRRSMAL